MNEIRSPYAMSFQELLFRIEELEQQNAMLLESLESTRERLQMFKALQGDTLSHWDVDDENALFMAEQAIAKGAVCREGLEVNDGNL